MARVSRNTSPHPNPLPKGEGTIKDSIMSPHDIPFDGAAFLSEKTEGLYEPGPGWESLGRVSQGSSRPNRKVTDAIPYFQEWARRPSGSSNTPSPTSTSSSSSSSGK